MDQDTAVAGLLAGGPTPLEFKDVVLVILLRSDVAGGFPLQTITPSCTLQTSSIFFDLSSRKYVQPVMSLPLNSFSSSANVDAVAITATSPLGIDA